MLLQLLLLEMKLNQLDMKLGNFFMRNLGYKV